MNFTLETSGEDVNFTLGTSGEDVNFTLETDEKDLLSFVCELLLLLNFCLS